MEITPSNTGRPESSLSPTNTSAVKLTSIDALGLSQNLTYNATVIGRYQTTESPTANPSLPSNNTSNQASSAPVQEWLILIKDKTLLIATTENLSKGQALEVILAPTKSASAEPALLIKSSSMGDIAKPSSESFITQPISLLLKAMSQSLPRQMSLAAGLSILNEYALQPNQQASQTAQSNNTAVSPSNATLASATIQLLRPLWLNQASLLTELNNALSPNQSALQTPNATQTPSTSTTTAPTASPSAQADNAAKQIRAALENSGIMLENKLLAVPSQKAFVSLQQTLIQTLTLLMPASTEQSSGQTSTQVNTKSPANIATQLTAKLNPTLLVDKPSPSPLPNQAPASATQDHAALTAKQLLTSYQQLASSASLNQASASSSLISSLKTLHNTINPEAFKHNAAIYDSLKTVQTQTLELIGKIALNSQSAAPTSDLKSTLTGLLAAVQTQVPKSPTASAFIDGATQANLLNSPFAFPHPAANMAMHNATKKADAMLAGQELSTGQILKLLAGMLNRLQFNQLNAVYQSQSNTSETTQTQSWFFELPMTTAHQQPDFFSLRLDRERSTKDDPSEPDDRIEQWRINLSFTLESLGEMTIQAKLSPPTISASIWSKSDEILKLVKTEETALRQRLEGIGLEVADVQCLRGQPVDNSANIDKQFVDTRA